MKPNILLAETKTPNGARMTLVEHDGSYCIRVNGQQLMHSAVATSEVQLGALGCERHAKAKAGLRVLIGGLGLGFTLRSVLATVGPKAVIEVAELFPEIVAWNRTHLAKLNGDALKDKRVTVFESDVQTLIRRAQRTPYDVIMLDIDNGTTAMVMTKNHELYSEAGIERIAAAVKPEGRVTIWSACPDAVLEKRMKRAGLVVTPTPAKLYPTAKRAAYMLYVGDKPAVKVAPLK
jgi:spermidine synthase